MSRHAGARSSGAVQMAVEHWSEPLKWHTELGTVSGKGNDSEEKAILPEISTNGRGADEDLRKRR